jgi:peptidoglycan/LPS O-acetylase OafA/YrhL
MSLLFLKGSFLNFTDNSGSLIKITFLGIVRNVNGQDASITENILPLSVIILLIPALSLVAVFFFKKRNIQMWFVRILIGVVCCLILAAVYYSYLIMTENGGNIIPGVLMLLPLVLLLFAVLAFRGIRKDDRLVKSYDRMR